MEISEELTTDNYTYNNTTTANGLIYTEGFSCGRKVLFLSIKVILCVSAVVGNSLVILSVCKYRHMRTIDNILICNLAVSSVFVATYVLTDILNVVFDIVDMSLKYTCLFKTSDTLMVLLSSVFNLLLMSTERYIAVVHPLRFRTIVTFKRVKVTLALVWTSYIVFSYVPVVGLNTFDMPDAGHARITDHTGCSLHSVLNKGYGTALFMLLLFGTTVNLVLFIRVLFVVYRSIRKRKRDLRTPTSSNGKTLTVLVTLCSFVLCWIPFVIGGVMKVKETNIVETCLIVSPYKIGIIYSSMSWIIYGLMRPKFRRCFRAILTCKPLQSHSLYAGTTKESFSTSSAMLRRTTR